MRWQTGDSNTKKEAEIVIPGWYTGEIQYADDVPKYNSIKITMDTDEGSRVKFNIKPRHIRDVNSAIGKSGDDLEASDLPGKRIMVELDQWSPEDSDMVYNTLKSVKEAKEASNGVPKDDIPF